MDRLRQLPGFCVIIKMRTVRLMTSGMDKKTFIRNLKQAFCDFTREGVKYTEVWLSDVDFGGLYYSDKYILHVKAEHDISSCSPEISSILHFLNEHAHEELQAIWSVYVYNSSDEVHCLSENLVFTDEQACKNNPPLSAYFNWPKEFFLYLRISCRFNKRRNNL